ncbi:DUF21 domain-containing protein [Elusimicrobiota bacterium]
MIWLGIILCISQSAILSGLNLAFFSVGRLRLEVEAASGNERANKILALRKNSNFLLATILWGNVAANALLAILADSIMAGFSAFIFSTVFITFFGEIIPQAYFSRHAMQVASALSPVLRAYQILLFPMAFITAKLLDWWIGPEGTMYFKEKHLIELIKKHIASREIDKMEGIGALNFLAIDDLPASQEGEIVDPRSIIKMQFKDNHPVFPAFKRSKGDPFLRLVESSAMKWVVFVNDFGDPIFVLDADGFLRKALFSGAPFNPMNFCHRPIIIKSPKTPLGEILHRWKIGSCLPHDDVIDADIILVWDEHKRIITGSDILGRLLRGISGRDEACDIHPQGK